MYRGIFVLTMMILMTSCFKKAGDVVMEDDTDLRVLSAMEIFKESNKEFREKINSEYSSPEKSPLLKEDRLVFDSLPFFKLNIEHRVRARFERVKDSKSFQMPTTTERTPIYKVYGKAHFTLRDTAYTLSIYQNQDPKFQKMYPGYLFLPFRDMTNGVESYGGGRFMDLRIPEDDMIIIDFNQAYNPLCAYNSKYSCPIPPSENTLPTKIMAGVKYDSEKYEH